MSESKPYVIYDFDNTIYKGDCSIDFYWYCLRHKPTLLRFVPVQLWHFAKYFLGQEDKNSLKGNYFVFLRGLGDTEKYVAKFWKRHGKNIKKWYRDIDHSRDIIISASPDFLIRPIFNELKAHRLIATQANSKTGKLDGPNCRGEEKVIRLQRELPNIQVQKTYSDSLHDLPILGLAKEPYVVKGNRIMALDAYATLPTMRKLWLTWTGRWHQSKTH